jgi:stage II sporulation protein AA (anti-sigma F factor antagonist)
MQVEEPVLRMMQNVTGDGTVVLTVQGEIDLATAGDLESRLADACATHEAVTVDLRRVSFLDCVGLQLLLDQHARGEARGCRVDFVQGPEPVRRVFELTGTLEQLPFVAAGASHLAAASTG